MSAMKRAIGMTESRASELGIAPLAYAAALMGLSPPTMKQRLAARQNAN